MIDYLQAPVESTSATLTVERRWANATQEQIDQYIERVRGDPQGNPDYSVADGRLYHSSVDMGRRAILSLEERPNVFSREYERSGKLSKGQFIISCAVST